MINWLEKKLKKIKPRELMIAYLGDMLFTLTLGALLSRHMVPYTYILLIIATLMIVNFSFNALQQHLEKKKVAFKTLFYIFLTGYLFAFILGTQTPFIPFKVPLLIIGLIMLIPALKEMVK